MLGYLPTPFQYIIINYLNQDRINNLQHTYPEVDYKYIYIIKMATINNIAFGE